MRSFMALDVATLLVEYEQEPTQVPMHGQRGEVRRNPSADQKKVRRQMTKKQAAEEATANETIAQLLRRASVAPTLAEQQELMHEVERLKTAKLAHYDASRALDLTVTESVEIVPRGMHEHHTASTDWVMGLQVTADATEAEHELVAQASLWFDRVPDYVKEDPHEFRIQAGNLARHKASAFGDAAESAAQAFLTEADRLYRQGQKTGAFQVNAMLVHDLDDPNGGLVDHPVAPGPRPDNQAPYVTDPHHAPKAGPHLDASIPDAHGPELLEHPLVDREIDRHLSGQDASGVREMAQGYAGHALRGGSLQRSASAQATLDQDDQLAAVLAGFEVTAGPEMLAELAEGGGAAAEMPSVPGMPGGGEGGSGGGVAHNLDASSNGVRDAAESYAQQQVQAASQVPQVGSYGPGGTEGLPTDSFSTFGDQGADPNTSSNRSPALQELQDFTGWDGSSVVPQGDTGAAASNNDSGERDATGGPAGFPVSGSLHKKESSMPEAQCPTCGGHGRVAVRKQAYSGLPQIDQIVNADETSAPTPLPDQVAFPLTGWGETPQQGGQNVQNAVNQAEQQIADRNKRSPLVTGTTAGQRQANGRDNSGWMGDMGAKGTDYPGYSTPNYGGGNNLGEPDPVYGYGGDNGNQPLRPYGEMEANDETNNPSEPFQYGVPHNNDQAGASVSQQMSTQGSQDPFIAQAQAEQARLNQVIAARQRQLAQQGR